MLVPAQSRLGVRSLSCTSSVQSKDLTLAPWAAARPESCASRQRRVGVAALATLAMAQGTSWLCAPYARALTQRKPPARRALHTCRMPWLQPIARCKADSRPWPSGSRSTRPTPSATVGVATGIAQRMP